MPFTLPDRLNEREPVYSQIVRQIKVDLATGRLRSGEALPSRRELAAILGVNPNTVQKAYRLLEEEGILITSPNARSHIRADEDALRRLRGELTGEAAEDFVSRAKELGFDFKDAIGLLTEKWQ